MSNIQKIIQRSSKLADEIERAFNDDITLFVKRLCSECDILSKQTRTPIDQHLLMKIVQNHFSFNKQCLAVTKSGLQCTRKSVDNTKYCKTHYAFKFRQNEIDTVNYETSLAEIVPNASNVCTTNLSKKFIGDSVYYTDQEYIYDVETLDKCGFVRQNEFILSDDPFELGLF